MTSSDPIDKFLDLAGELLRSASAMEAPVRKGVLRGDITVFERKQNEVSVGNTALVDYAKYVFFGTKPHPKNHPGTKPNPYLERGLDRIVSSGQLGRLLDQFGDEMSDEMFETISADLKNIKIK